MKVTAISKPLDITDRIHANMFIESCIKTSNTRIGTVAGIKDDRFIKLRKRDTPDGKRRFIPLEWVLAVEGNTVLISKKAETVRRTWLTKAAVKKRSKKLHGSLPIDNSVIDV
jgi:hypothetical protein